MEDIQKYILACLLLLFTICVLVCLISSKSPSVPVPPVPTGSIAPILPPRIPGIPIFGILLHIFIFSKNYTAKFTEVKRRWGNVTQAQLGSHKCIWINDGKLIREAWSNPSFCGRPKIPGITERTHGISGGIIFNDGPTFQEQRRFVLKTLKKLGFCKLSMEVLIQEEAQALVQKIRCLGSAPISTEHYFHASSVNALWKIVTGEKLSSNLKESEIQNLIKALDRNMKLSHGAKLGFFLPWLRKLCPELIGWNSYLKDANEIFIFWKKYAEKRVAEFDKKQQQQLECDNFVDLYIKEVQNCKDQSSSFFDERGVTSLGLVLQDLFIAGTETTATMIRWGLLYLATFQDVQSKVFHEISQIIAPGEIPCLAHRTILVYANAFIHEVLRFGTLAPLGMLHCTTENAVLGGYFIPKHTIVQANLCGVHRDPEYWYKPDQFIPERFITTDQDTNTRKLFVRNDGFLPFSYGKRNCIGEILAKDELFIFFTSIVQSFHIHIDPNNKCHDLEPEIGVSAMPKAHKLIFNERKRKLVSKL